MDLGFCLIKVQMLSENQPQCDAQYAHYNSNTRRFHTPGAPPMASWSAALKWHFGFRKDGAPPRTKWPHWIDIVPLEIPARPTQMSDSIIATWINHSTFFVQTAGLNFIFDPIFSRCCGPFGKLGHARVHAPGIALDALPAIDFVLLSHDHYDHCDLQSLRHIVRRAPRVHKPIGITPIGNGTLLRRAGFADNHIVELDWWQTHIPKTMQEMEIARQIQITLTPSQHWSKRLTSARNRRLWGGFYITVGPRTEDLKIDAAGNMQRRVYFAGDTGYNPWIFREIGTRLGAPDLAMLPIGAYEPRWFMSPQHCNPAEAVQIHREIGSRQSVAMHWGTFQMTDEARDEPPRALGAALQAAGVPAESFKVLAPGESISV